MITCREAIVEAFENESGVLTTDQVTQRVYSRHLDQPWKEGTISCHLIGMSVNHPSSRHYPSQRKHAFLFSLGGGRYRRWNPQRDGTWVVTDTGVQLVDEGGDALMPEDESESEADYVGTSVSLERDLERSLLANLEQLKPGLKLYTGEGTSGYQLDTGVVGRLDILAVDNQGNYVVIELKAGEADERVCAQILRYMGWVKRELAKGKPVRGIIVANDFHERARYAVEAMPNVVLKRYQVLFRFLDV